MSIINDVCPDLSMDESTNVEEVVSNDVSSNDKNPNKKQKSKKEKSSNEVKYICRITGQTFTQKSHYDKHLTTEKYQDKLEIFKLRLDKLTNDELMKEYQTTNKDDILNYMVNGKLLRKQVNGSIVFDIKNDKQKKADETYLKHKSELESVITDCHNKLYSSGIVGVKAINDIVKILSIKFIEPTFNDKESSLYKKCINLSSLPQDTIDEYIKYSQDIKNILKENGGYEDIIEVWDRYMDEFLEKVLPNLFNENDRKFNCKDEKKINAIIKSISKLKITDEMINSFATINGDIHEFFRSSYGKGAKELGQYFTPRKLINVILNGIGLDKLFKLTDDTKIYDPCMGTGAFLFRLSNNKLNPDNIYGCEIESDTIKMGQLSMYVMNKKISDNIRNVNSITNNDLILNNKFDIIVTNPPFGTKINYKDDIETTFKTFISNKNSNISINDIYPLKNNNGACLFTQQCVYSLNENGVCAIVLPDGELFEGNSKWSKTFRKWLAETVNIKTILKVPSGTFEHAGVKTNVIVFTKDGPTKNIRFMETTKECNIVKDMFSITVDELKKTGYSLDIGEYLEEKNDNYNVPMVSLGEVCDIINGSQLDKKNIKEGEYPVFGGGKKNVGSHNEYNRNGGETIVCGTGAYCGYVQRILTPYWASQCFTISTTTDSLLSNYLYYLSKYSLETKFMNSKKGGGQPYIRGSQFNNLKIPLPSLEVQQQIVDELTQIETSIETIETRIAQLNREKDLYKKYGRKAEIRELLKDSEEKMLGEVCKISQGSSISTKDRIKGIIPYYGSNGIIDYLDKTQFEGEYIITGRVGTLGKYHYINGPFSLCDNAFYMKPKSNKLIIKYLYLYSKYVYANKFTNTSGPVPSFNRTKFNSFKIPLPSLEVQQQCIKLFEEKEKFIQSIDDKIEQNKNDIEELKKLAKDVITSFC